MTMHDDDLIPPDPRFPNRPHTLDFARLSSAASEQDAVADAVSLSEALEVDTLSLLYMAQERIRMTGIEPDPLSLALYLDAFQLGVGFTKRGGSRNNEGEAQ